MTICYFDLDNFKPFNDVFGFSKGDEVIVLVAELLTDNIDVNTNFVGHCQASRQVQAGQFSLYPPAAG
ncbi:MAG: diguanylate cyclase [Deltaproteobacteria bacterium]|nr:diguanylate cyclase [Deltaproteobacteria bacterium]